MAYRALLFRLILFLTSPVLLLVILGLITFFSTFPSDMPHDAIASYLEICILPLVGVRVWLWHYFERSFHAAWNLDMFRLMDYMQYLQLIKETPQMKQTRPFGFTRVVLLETILSRGEGFTKEQFAAVEGYVRNWDVQSLHTMASDSSEAGHLVEYIELVLVVYYHPSECVNYSLLVAILGPTRDRGYKAVTLASAEHRSAYVPTAQAKFKRFPQYYYHHGETNIHSIRHLLS